LQAVQPHYERIVEAALAVELSRKMLRRLFGGEASYTDAVEMSRRRRILLHKDGVVPAQIGLQPVSVFALLKCPDLHREGASERRRARYKFKPHGRDARSHHIDGMSGGQRQIDEAAFDEGAPINDAHLRMLAVIQIGHPDDAAKGQRAMGGDKPVHIEYFAARRFAPMKRRAIPGGHASFDVGSGRDFPLRREGR